MPNSLKDMAKDFINTDLTWEDTEKELKNWSDSAGLHIYTCTQIFFIISSVYLRNIYIDNNIPIDIYEEVCKDLLYKHRECQEVYGIYGNFTGDWYVDFLKFKRFTLGRDRKSVV